MRKIKMMAEAQSFSALLPNRLPKNSGMVALPAFTGRQRKGANGHGRYDGQNGPSGDILRHDGGDRHSGMVALSRCWVITRVRRPSTTQARREPKKALQRYCHGRLVESQTTN